VKFLECSEAFSPGGLSGFFRTHIVEGDYLKSGAWGAGLALDRGVFVRVRFAKEPGVIKTFLNGFSGDYFVAKTVVKEILKRSDINRGIIIEQVTDLPIGGGLGTSGASALATALATAKLVGYKASYMELARIAHIADIVNGTGLGTVSGLVVGGAVMVVSPGAPGYDRVDRILVGSNVKVVVGFFGPINKRDVISSDKISEIDKLGEVALEELVREPTIENFVRVSRWFAEESGLITKNVRKALEKIDKLDVIGASMAMIGDTVYVLTDNDLLEDVVSGLRDVGAKVYVSSIAWTPAYLIR